MRVQKIVKTLDNHKTSEWNDLVLEVLGTKVHPNRVQGFLLSRQALLEAMAEFGKNLRIKDLDLEEFHQLKKEKDYTLSLSHSKDVGAALVVKKTDFRSVGIDIEDENRIVKDTILERVSHPEDLNLRKIELWCLKEAAFKALMNSQNFDKPVEFSSIIISRHTWSHPPSALEGEWEIQIQEGLVVAKAFLKN